MNALLRIVHPLFFVGLVVLAVGLRTILRESKESRPAGVFFAIAGVFLVLLTGKELVFGPSSEIAAFRMAEASKVVAFEIGPIDSRFTTGQLLYRTIRVTDRARIERLVALLRATTHASPNHPKGGWMAELRIEDGLGRHKAIVSWTSDGLLLRIDGSGVGHDFRQEELKGFLEEIARTVP